MQEAPTSTWLQKATGKKEKRCLQVSITAVSRSDLGLRSSDRDSSFYKEREASLENLVISPNSSRLKEKEAQHRPSYIYIISAVSEIRRKEKRHSIGLIEYIILAVCECCRISEGNHKGVRTLS